MADLDSIYSPLKAAHHWDRIQQLREGKQPAPVFVQIMISDLCNHDCDFCAYRMSGYTSNEWFKVDDPVTGLVSNNPNRMIPYEKVVEILDDCVAMGVKACEITGGGEPTVHPKSRDIFRDVISHGLDGGLVTNGMLFREGTPEILSNFKWVRVSVDAGTAETYSRMRSVPDQSYARTLSNIEALVRCKANNPDSETIVGVGYVVTKDNYNEILMAVERFAGMGVDNIRLSAVFTPENAKYFEGIYQECKDITLEAVAKYSRPDFKVFNLFGDRLADLEQGRPDYKKCQFINWQTIIGGDQNVYFCCNTAYNPQGFIGSIKNQSFKALWESKAKRDRFDAFDATTCERCMFNQKNKTIAYLVQAKPDHSNFI